MTLNNHPHIAAIHGLEEVEGRPFLVLELVEGEDLSERIKRGPIPLDEALEIAQQVAEGMEEAHAKGVVHRDLKPPNIRVTADGNVKILDFGLAKAYAGERGEGSVSDLSQSPTLAKSGTEVGVILGTAAYMSPEQARGKTVDKRTDIWAFGVVLYEMLTGHKIFLGETLSDTIAAILKTEPEWKKLSAEVPPPVRRLLRRCLELRRAADGRGAAALYAGDPPGRGERRKSPRAPDVLRAGQRRDRAQRGTVVQAPQREGPGERGGAEVTGGQGRGLAGKDP